MRIGNLSDRLVLVTDQGAIDVEKSSAGRFGADPQAVYGRWHEFREWAATASTDDAAPFRLDELGPPAPQPAQVFAVGANYRSHADEGGLATPEWPMVFAKYVSSFTGPVGEIELPTGAVDWEVELVAVKDSSPGTSLRSGRGTMSRDSPSARTFRSVTFSCGENFPR